MEIKIVLPLLSFTEKSLYFIGKHIRNCFLLPDFTFNDLITCFISETWRVLVVKHIVLTNLDHLIPSNKEVSCFSCGIPQFAWLSALIDIGFWYYHHHHHHIHFRALFSSTECWAFWQVFLEGVLSTQNGSEGQQNPYLASFCLKHFIPWFPWPARSFLCNHIQLAYFCNPACAALYMSKPSHPTGAEHHI